MAADQRAIRQQRKRERDLKTADAVLEVMRVEGAALYVTICRTGPFGSSPTARKYRKPSQESWSCSPTSSVSATH
jgi:hypothetical protein